MRHTRMTLVVGGLIALAACGSESTSPIQNPEPQIPASAEGIDLISDFGFTAAADIDGSGIGGSSLPDSLKLTTEQKAKIDSLHDAFRTARQADLKALEGIEKAARKAREEGKGKEVVDSILATAAPIRERLNGAFIKLLTDLKAVYTPAQLTWIYSQQLPMCGPNGRPKLTEGQVAARRALREAFIEATKADKEIVKKVAREARQAREEGKPEADVAAILAKAADAHTRINAAEDKLRADLLQTLTPRQRADWCRIGNG
jgi:Spy/CpxP family protein refolding chaperone